LRAVPRSWLFVPGDSEKKLLKTPETGAHALTHRSGGRGRALRPANRAAHDARLAGGAQTPDHDAKAGSVGADQRRGYRHVARGSCGGDGRGAEGIMLPKAEGPDQIRQVAAEIYELEQRHGIPNGQTRLLPLVSETPRAALTITAYMDASMPRLAGLTWGAEDLSAELGASRKRDSEGQWTDPFRFVRAQTLLVAHARGVWPIDTLYADFRDEDGTRRAAEAARADGFAGMLAIHPFASATDQ